MAISVQQPLTILCHYFNTEFSPILGANIPLPSQDEDSTSAVDIKSDSERDNEGNLLEEEKETIGTDDSNLAIGQSQSMTQIIPLNSTPSASPYPSRNRPETVGTALTPLKMGSVASSGGSLPPLPPISASEMSNDKDFESCLSPNQPFLLQVEIIPHVIPLQLLEVLPIIV